MDVYTCMHTHPPTHPPTHTHTHAHTHTIVKNTHLCSTEAERHCFICFCLCFICIFLRLLNTNLCSTEAKRHCFIFFLVFFVVLFLVFFVPFIEHKPLQHGGRKNIVFSFFRHCFSFVFCSFVFKIYFVFKKDIFLFIYFQERHCFYICILFICFQTTSSARRRR